MSLAMISKAGKMNQISPLYMLPTNVIDAPMINSKIRCVQPKILNWYLYCLFSKENTNIIKPTVVTDKRTDDVKTEGNQVVIVHHHSQDGVIIAEREQLFGKQLRVQEEDGHTEKMPKIVSRQYQFMHRNRGRFMLFSLSRFLFKLRISLNISTFTTNTSKAQ